ncbi:hypothetical protein [Streptomyces lydicus]
MGALPICGTDDKPKGVLTDRDIIVKALGKGRDPQQTKAVELAQGEAVTIGADDDADEIFATMARHKVRACPSSTATASSAWSLRPTSPASCCRRTCESAQVSTDERAQSDVRLGARREVGACDDRGVESPDPSFRRRLLIESLTMLAADAQTQVAWLNKHGVMTDEIALDFDHAFRLAEVLVAEGQLTGEVTADLREIDVILSGMSDDGNAERWTRDALSTAG